MALDPGLQATLNETIYVAPPSTRSAHGDVTFGAPASAPARVEVRNKVFTLPNGESRGTTHRIITEAVITLDHRVWLPGVDQTNATLARQPLQVAIPKNEDGTVSHYEVDV